MNELFFELIRISIGHQDKLCRQPSQKEWTAIYDMAIRQSLVGVCFAGAQKLCYFDTGNYAGMSELQYLTWMGMAAMIQQQCSHHKEVCVRVNEHLARNDVRALFMKGLVCAERYPQPELRQCGDIDFVVAKVDYPRTLDLLDQIGVVNRELVHEHHGMAWVDGVQLEPHYKIHNYQNPRNDRMMQKLQKELFANYSDKPLSHTIEQFPIEFEGMFLVSHMVNHVYEEGVGMRQVMDFFFWIKDLPNHKGFDNELYYAYLDKMQMRRAARIFTRICEKYMGLEHSILGYGYTEREIVFADRMMDDIMAVGNFARGAAERPMAGWSAYKWTTKRCWKLGYLCPSEARWWPVSKFYRFFWKKCCKSNDR